MASCETQRLAARRCMKGNLFQEKDDEKCWSCAERAVQDQEQTNCLAIIRGTCESYASCLPDCGLCYDKVQAFVECRATRVQNGSNCTQRTCACSRHRDSFQSCVQGHANTGNGINFTACRQCVVGTAVRNDRQEATCEERIEKTCRAPDRCDKDCGNCGEEARGWLQECSTSNGVMMGTCRPFECPTTGLTPNAAPVLHKPTTTSSSPVMSPSMGSQPTESPSSGGPTMAPSSNIGDAVPLIEVGDMSNSTSSLSNSATIGIVTGSCVMLLLVMMLVILRKCRHRVGAAFKSSYDESIIVVPDNSSRSGVSRTVCGGSVVNTVSHRHLDQDPTILSVGSVSDDDLDTVDLDDGIGDVNNARSGASTSLYDVGSVASSSGSTYSAFDERNEPVVWKNTSKVASAAAISLRTIKEASTFSATTVPHSNTQRHYKS